MQWIKSHPLISGATALLLLIGGCILVVENSGDPAQWKFRAGKNLRQGYVDHAWSDVQRLLRRDPTDEVSLLLAAMVSVERDNIQAAREYYERIEEPLQLEWYIDLAELCIQKRHLELAEQCLKDVRSRRPRHESSTGYLMQVYRISYRRWEHRPLLLELSAQGVAPIPDVRMLYDVPGPTSSGDTEFRNLATDVHDPDRVVRLTACINLAMRGQPDLAREALAEYVQDHPDMLEAQAWYGRLLLDPFEETLLEQWLSQLPPEAYSHPEIWYVVGSLRHRQGATWQAAAAFRKALLIDYRHLEALQGLLELAGNVSLEEQEETLRELESLMRNLRDLVQNPPVRRDQPEDSIDHEWGLSILDLSVQLGWLPEADAWCGLLRKHAVQGAIERRAQIQARLRGSTDDSNSYLPARPLVLDALEALKGLDITPDQL